MILPSELVGGRVPEIVGVVPAEGDGSVPPFVVGVDGLLLGFVEVLAVPEVSGVLGVLGTLGVTRVPGMLGVLELLWESVLPEVTGELGLLELPDVPGIPEWVVLGPVEPPEVAGTLSD